MTPQPGRRLPPFDILARFALVLLADFALISHRAKMPVNVGSQAIIVCELGWISLPARLAN
jgi:hypothetical protein